MDGSEVMRALEPSLEELMKLLPPVEDCWQPSGLLPDLASEAGLGELAALRERALELSDELLVMLVGTTVTEEALPSYQTSINRNEGIGDPDGMGDSAWARWSRGWTAEEGRHGAVLRAYLYLTGRVDARALDVTCQHLLRRGFDARTDRDPYRFLVYTAFQERATKTAHKAIGILADKCGEGLLRRICGHVAADEARHEEVYKKLFGRVLEIDPDEGLLACQRMLAREFEFPARFMFDGSNPDLFRDYGIAAQRSKVFGYHDYVEILDHLLRSWDIAGLRGLSPAAQRAQEYVLELPDRYRRRGALVDKVLHKLPRTSFAWIFGREV